MNEKLRTVVVDMTPVLPGGDNGGAKIFVIELVQRLAEMSPSTQFVLLTQSSSHDELAKLDRTNIRRLKVVEAFEKKSLLHRMRALAAHFIPHLHFRLRRLVGHIGYKVSKAHKRGKVSNTLLRDIGADLLFCPFTSPTYFEPRTPTVCTIYDLQFKAYPEFFAVEDVLHRENSFLEACKKATVLAAISDYSRKEAISYGNIEPNRIRTIYLRMAQRLEIGVEQNKEILVKHGLKHKRYLIYPANFWKHKNHEMLITAFGMACHGGIESDVNLVCTGAPGTRQDWLIKTVRAIGLENRIIFPGYLPNIDLAVLIKNCAGVVFPSLYEGFGLPVIEAMAAGVPVACSNTTSLPEIASDAVILFDPRVPKQITDAIVSMVENEKLCKKMIKAGLQRSTEFSDVTRMASEYWDLFLYAFSNKNNSNSLMTGAYSDGWAGKFLSIQVAPSSISQTIEIEFSAPEWLPQSSVCVQVITNGNRTIDKIVIDRGSSSSLSCLMEPAGGCLEISLSPTFIPACFGHGDDQRELSAMVQRCGIARNNGEYVQLFPRKISV